MKDAVFAGHSLVSIRKTEVLPAATAHDDGVITRYQKLSQQQFQNQQEELRRITNEIVGRMGNSFTVMINDVKSPKKLDKNAFRKFLFDKRDKKSSESETLCYAMRKETRRYICARCGNLKFSAHSYCGVCSDELCDFPATYTKPISSQIYFLIDRAYQYVRCSTKHARYFFKKYQNPEGVRMHADTLYDIESGNLALTPRWVRV